MANHPTETLETVLQKIATRQATEVAHTVRTYLEGILDHAGRAAPNVTAKAAAAPAHASPTAAKRKPGRPPKAAAAAAPVKSPKARPAAARAGKLRRGWSDADVEKVHAFIASNPGHRSEQIGKALKVESAVMFKVLSRLRETKRVTVKGYGRGGAYSAS